jgi:predicted DNA-binding protein
MAKHSRKRVVRFGRCIGIRLPNDLQNRLDAMAASEGNHASAICRRLISAALVDSGTKTKSKAPRTG